MTSNLVGAACSDVEATMGREDDGEGSNRAAGIRSGPPARGTRACFGVEAFPKLEHYLVLDKGRWRVWTDFTCSIRPRKIPLN